MSSAPDSSASDRATILFVDDEPLSQKYFKASVGKYANVLTASGPDAALEILAADGDRISVVVSDERMPRESGVSFLTNVRKAWPSTVRILTSAYADIENLQQAINGAGVYRFVPKPWDFDELCKTMQEALAAEHAGEHTDIPSEDAENANVQLLAIMARELERPLTSIENDAIRLASLTAPRAIHSSSGPTDSSSRLATWSAQLRGGQIAATANRVYRNSRRVRSLASSIGELAAGLCEPYPMQTPSMAETVSEALEQLAANRAAGKITLDARSDFRYRAPKVIMKFVLLKLLEAASEQARGGGIAIEWAPAPEFAEVRITLHGSSAASELANYKFDRSARSVLWAFGGELRLKNEESSDKLTTIVRMPNADAQGDVSPNR
jgi:two-component system probable response regulator PhcQ